MIMSKKRETRENFRTVVFKRDKNKCKVCGVHKDLVKLDAHHITNRNAFVNGGYVLSNGITLCDQENGCHFKAEEYLVKMRTEQFSPFDKFHPSSLYRLIKSSSDQAFLDDENIK